MDTFFTVRARTTTADHEAGQKALLRMLDRSAAESVEEALDGRPDVGRARPGGRGRRGGRVSGYRAYLEDPEPNGSLIGCEWRVEVIA